MAEVAIVQQPVADQRAAPGADGAGRDRGRGSRVEGVGVEDGLHLVPSLGSVSATLGLRMLSPTRAAGLTGCTAGGLVHWCPSGWFSRELDFAARQGRRAGGAVQRRSPRARGDAHPATRGGPVPRRQRRLSRRELMWRRRRRRTFRMRHWDAPTGVNECGLRNGDLGARSFWKAAVSCCLG